ncbi:hypothetical protein R9X47_14560 [Wukongibacter baidiensis]|uniref:hypothetical protein n=1 Tax=Wukongibacter baidiensis TaxID=1723361 RepID=UPI003D7F8E9B
MLKLSLIELFLRLIPEGFILALSIYAFSNTEINVKRYIISGIILTVNPYFIRMLPINFGVHTILLIMCYILVAANINGLEILKAIKSGLIAYIVLSVCEFANLFFVSNVLNISVEKVVENIALKMLLGLPSLILFLIIVFYFYKKTEENKNV